MKTKNKWLSPVPEVCDMCKSKFGKHFYDAATIYGPWANLCEPCFDTFGKGLGIGLGQKYVTKTREGVAGFEE